MANLERTYNVPLRKEFSRAPRYKRTARAMRALRDFLLKHMKGEEVKIGKHLNEKMWEHGIKNPPHHVKVTAVKDDKGIVMAELEGVKFEEKKADKKEKKAPSGTPQDKVADLKKKLEGAMPKAKKEDKPAAEKPTPVKEETPKTESKPKPATEKVPTAAELAAKKNSEKKDQ